MNFRPHIHMIVSGGGLTRFGQFRTTSRKEFFLPLSQLAAGFRGRFLSRVKELHEAGNLFLPDSLVDPSNPFGFQSFIDSMFRKKWLPFITETFVGNGVDAHGKSKGNAIRYLARYLFRTGISNRRIIQVTDTDVFFTYKDYRNGGAVTPTSMSGPDFVAAFLNLIMPARCPKVRYYGILANCSKTRCLKLVFQLLNVDFNPVKLHGPGISTSTVVMSIHGVDIDLCPLCKKTHMVQIPRIKIPFYRPSRDRIQQYILQRRMALFPAT